MSTTIQYKGNTLATVSNNTKTLKTAGKYMEGDVVLTDVSGGSEAISVVDTLDANGGTIRTITAVDISDTTAQASDVAQGKYFYTADGTKTAGTSTGGGGGGLYDYFGAGTEYVGKVFSETYNLADDTSFDSWTASTTATVIKSQSTTYDVEVNIENRNYDYFVVLKSLTKFAYKNGTENKNIMTTLAEIRCNCVTFEPYSYSTWHSGTHGTPNVSASYSKMIGYFYSTNNALDYVTSAYGVYKTGAPSGSLSATLYRLKTPAIYARCNSSFFDISQKENVDSENTTITYEVEVYRTPKSYVQEMVDELCTLLNN